ncbi:uncharacterized protein LOC130922430 isoform X2 [Corythoichthys intestinalis]|uniref:uncharacterized protein LOC130922430 isoform X2 n=1 Tax=Corythoichthys intestinalis TaxID=161448 RepID=UPI0025A60157|nr:uncharacterized protein LOC130922430 isoform X2 [Corythoichthys intestinalis]XP_057703222.1 uncharacterized protein LOC130922430 isoform X2 [Corythoichthys intestinalis]XP_057703232.1 uncharacterized protein LOC130922430 isoform X2 [Corythoichthys intestinalis]XP_057703242.1 uncharacterized protein LOC130922430 isoform X2 [Corythoichthys intestinalis]
MQHSRKYLQEIPSNAIDIIIGLTDEELLNHVEQYYAVTTSPREAEEVTGETALLQCGRDSPGPSTAHPEYALSEPSVAPDAIADTATPRGAEEVTGETALLPGGRDSPGASTTHLEYALSEPSVAPDAIPSTYYAHEGAACNPECRLTVNLLWERLQQSLMPRSDSPTERSPRLATMSPPSPLTVKSEPPFEYGQLSATMSLPSPLTVRSESPFEYGQRLLTWSPPPPLTVKSEPPFEYGQRLLTPSPPNLLQRLTTIEPYYPPFGVVDLPSDGADVSLGFGGPTPLCVDAAVQAGIGDGNIWCQTGVTTQTGDLSGDWVEEPTAGPHNHYPGVGPIRHEPQRHLYNPCGDHQRPGSTSTHSQRFYTTPESRSPPGRYTVHPPPVTPLSQRVENQPIDLPFPGRDRLEHPAYLSGLPLPSISVTINEVVVLLSARPSSDSTPASLPSLLVLHQLPISVPSNIHP